MLMIIALLVVFGLTLGSFVNALVCRVHEQAKELDRPKPNKKYLKTLSISKGRSICLSCKHPLASKDLVPVLSWLQLRGKCRYCRKPIPDTPLAELLTPFLFVTSYLLWPYTFSSMQKAAFVTWLLLIVGFVALIIYDVRWKLLPDRIMLPMAGLAILYTGLQITDGSMLKGLVNAVLAVAVGGGIFYILFQISDGKWIGGGDVKLGWLLGLLVGDPAKAALMLFVAALGGSLFSLPLMATGKLKRSTTIPFGPFLIVGAMVAVLFGTDLLDWYKNLFILG